MPGIFYFRLFINIVEKNVCAIWLINHYDNFVRATLEVDNSLFVVGLELI
jgi:hypothetical protein